MSTQIFSDGTGKKAKADENSSHIKADSNLPDGWSAHVDPESGCEYYFHATTGQSTWERPKPPSSLPSPPPRSSLVLQKPITEDSSAVNKTGSTLQSAVTTFQAMAHREQLGMLWDNRAFVDLFLDGWKEHEKHSLGKNCFSSAIALIQGATSKINSSCDQYLKVFGAEKISCIKNLEQFIVSVSGITQSLPIKSKSEQQILEYIHSLTTSIRNLSTGSFLGIPGGWVTSPEESFALLLIVERTGIDEFALAVCNTGPDGLSYHPLRSDAVESCNMLYRMCLVIDHVPEARLADSSFWFMVARMQVSTRYFFSESSSCFAS